MTELANANGQQVTIGTDTATGIINDDDAAIISITGFSVNESLGTANFTIATNLTIQNAITVDFATSDVSALAGLDYTAVGPMTLNFGNGAANSQTVTIPINNDSWVEPTETLTGTLSNLVANSQNVTLTGAGATTTATGIILDNDTATVAINDRSVNEADGTATFTVTLSSTYASDASVNFATADGTATAGVRYTTTTATVTIPAGQTTGTVTVPILP